MAPASSNLWFRSWRTVVRTSTLVVFVAAIASIAISKPARAQVAPLPTGPTIEIGTGLFSGLHSNDPDSRFGMSVSGQFTQRVKTSRQLSWLMGFNASMFMKTSSDLVACVEIDPGQGQSRRCEGRDFPDARVFNVQTGIEHQVGTGIALRLLGGPALYKVWEAHAKWGMQGRADVAFHSRSHVAFVLWMQGGYMPIQKSPAGVPMLFGLGIRAQ